MSVQAAGRVSVDQYRHRPSHLDKLEPLPPGPDRSRPDAVVVPTRKGADSLAFAVRLAGELGVPILVLTTTAWSRSTARVCLDGRPGAVAGLPDALRDRFFGLRVGSVAGPTRYVDIGAKRNVGLRVARSQGWESILFLDDDIHGITAAEVCRAHATLRSSRLRAVGWQCTSFPDNSVVCHLRREVTLEQDSFIGSGALLVDLRGEVPFFPPVYNEDWLFLHDWTADGLVGVAGTVRQWPFDPFTVDRAANQEFGDVLAEGLFELMSRRDGHADPGRALGHGFWADVLAGRQAMLDEIRDRLILFGGMPEAQVSGRLREVLDAAHDACGLLDVRDLAGFVRAWREDLSTWSGQLAAVGRADLRTALGREGLDVVLVNS